MNKKSKSNPKDGKVSKAKKYKAGTVVTLHSSCNYVGCDTRQTMTLDVDFTEDQLQQYAWERSMDQIQVEGWFTVGEEE